MKTLETVGNNIKIAEFMGCLIAESKAGTGKIATRTDPSWHFPGTLEDKCHVNSLEYGSSWEWLMPVVSKASQTLLNDFDNYCDWDIGHLMNDDLGHHLRFGNRREVYGIVLKFIEWYSEQEV